MLPMYIDHGSLHTLAKELFIAIMMTGHGTFGSVCQHPQWTLIACAKHGDSSAKMRGCRMPKISSTILPLHCQTINMSWRYGRTCWCWWNRKIMQVAHTWAEWMFISLQNASQMIIKTSSLIEKQALVHVVLHGASAASILNLETVNKQLSLFHRLVKLLSNTKLLQFPIATILVRLV